MPLGAAPPKYPSCTRQTLWPYCEMWLVGSSAAPFSLEEKTRIARSTEMRAMPELFAFLPAASTARGGIFSCCRIREQTCRTSSTIRPPVNDIPSGHRVGALDGADARAHAASAPKRNPQTCDKWAVLLSITSAESEILSSRCGAVMSPTHVPS